MRTVLTVLIILILVLLSITFIHNKGYEKDALVISYNNFETELQIFLELDSSEITTKRGDKFVVVSLLDVSKLLNINISEYQKIVFQSSDGGSLAVNILEISDLYITETTQNGNQFYRLIIPQDDFSQRWLKMLNRVEFTYD